MRVIEKFGLALMILSVTACAPVVYDAGYGVPASNVYVHSGFEQPAYYNEAAYLPIEVTLYADNTYLGVYFQPMRLVIYDGQYVKIPVRDRRGRNSTIYAHYHQNNLHFDSDRNDHSINGSSRFNYDSRWDQGHRYSKLNAGKDYDMSGLNMQIRRVPAAVQHKNNTVMDKKNDRTSRTRDYDNKASAKQTLLAASRENQTNQSHKLVENRTNRYTDRQAPVIINKKVEKETEKQKNYQISNNKPATQQFRPVKATVQKTVTVGKTIKKEQSRQASVNTVKSINSEHRAGKAPVQIDNNGISRKNDRGNSEPQVVNKVAKKKTRKDKTEVAVTTVQQAESRSQDKRFVEEREVTDDMAQNKANEDVQTLRMKVFDKYRVSGRNNSLALNVAD